jgi:hypothetical protein
LVVISGVERPEIVVEPVVQGCSAAQCPLVQIKRNSDDLGTLWGVRRALAVGIRKGEKAEEEPLVASAGIPSFPWLTKTFKYEELKRGATLTQTTQAYYDKRMKRKETFRAKQAAIKQKHIADKRLEKHNAALEHQRENKRRKMEDKNKKKNFQRK